VQKPTYDEFVGYLRSSLHYLYDTVHLRRSPLIQLLGLGAEFDQGAALQRVLTNAIRTLKPDDDEPPQSTAWRIHDTLSLEYIRQYARDAVAMQLGISERQLRREQRLALEALAQRLWQNLDFTSFDAAPARTTETISTALPDKDQALSDELVSLQSFAQEQLEPLGEILQTVHDLLQPLARQWRTPLQVNIESGLADVPLSQPIMRSILLTILSVAIPLTSEGEAVITVRHTGTRMEIGITCTRINPPPVLDGDDPRMKTARQLAAFYGADIAIARHDSGFTVTLRLPVIEQIPVLVIDDNAGWDEMLKRYVVGSRYHIVGAHQPHAALSMAEKLQPAVIFLDVMMPEIDGWQVLSELRQEQSTSHIPIVVCTALPLEGLALSLGVNAFLQKPVTQDQFLGVLDKLITTSRRSSSSGMS